LIDCKRGKSLAYCCSSAPLRFHDAISDSHWNTAAKRGCVLFPWQVQAGGPQLPSASESWCCIGCEHSSLLRIAHLQVVTDHKRCPAACNREIQPCWESPVETSKPGAKGNCLACIKHHSHIVVAGLPCDSVIPWCLYRLHSSRKSTFNVVILKSSLELASSNPSEETSDY
jgi:hypothetical protein